MLLADVVSIYQISERMQVLAVDRRTPFAGLIVIGLFLNPPSGVAPVEVTKHKKRCKEYLSIILIK